MRGIANDGPAAHWRTRVSRPCTCRPGVDFSEAARLRDIATKEDPRSRGLTEARAFYAKPCNRVKGFSEKELRYMAEALDPALMARWGYRHPGGDADSGSATM